MAYCAITDVEALNALDAGTGYGTTSCPTATQVTGFINQVYAQINALLASKGITVPVTANDYLKMLNAIGAAAWAIAAAKMSGTAEGAEPRNFRMEQFRQWMLDLKNNPALSGGVSSQTANQIARSDITSGHETEVATFTKDGEDW